MAEFNPLSPQLRSDPYPIYRELREQDPVYWSPMMHLWVLTRYDDNLAVLRDHRTFSSDRLKARNPLVEQMEQYRLNSGPLGTTPTMLSLDPPAHTRMRNLVNKAFTPRVVERIRPQIREIAEQLLDELEDPGRMDVVADLAVPLPVIVIASVLGVPLSDRDRFKDWSNDIAAGLGGPFTTPDVLERSQQSANELAEYFREQVRIRRSEPSDDLMSALIAAEDEGDLLSEDELLATCMLLLIAGNETTTNLIGNGMLTLLHNPDQRLRLQADPSLLPAAVEEMLRYEGPAQITSRIVAEPTDLRGRQMEPGQVVLCVLGAANRDPEVFPEPDRFYVDRFATRHLAFGMGIHYCLGAPLAKAEAEIAFETLIRRFPEPAPAFEAPDWGPSFILRGLRSLPIVSRSVAPRA